MGILGGSEGGVGVCREVWGGVGGRFGGPARMGGGRGRFGGPARIRRGGWGFWGGIWGFCGVMGGERVGVLGGGRGGVLEEIWGS